MLLNALMTTQLIRQVAEAEIWHPCEMPDDLKNKMAEREMSF